MMGAMAISFNVGWETTMGAMGISCGTTGSAMMGHCLHQVDSSDQKDCVNLRVHLGLERSSISMSEESSNMDLRSSGLDMLIDGCAMKCHNPFPKLSLTQPI